MMKHTARSPLIILGMHRSGTTLVTKCLEALGLFVGVRKDSNNEAEFFLNLNTWMLRHAHSRWDNLYYYRFVDDAYRDQMVRLASGHLKGIGRANFLGWRKALKYRDIRDLDVPWGWKDPRNTFTIDIWKDIFPDAKVLHIYRNPLDVAVSLRTRELRWSFRPRTRDFRKERRLEGIVEYLYSPRVRDIREGVSLWTEYVTKAFSLEEEFRGRIFHVRYESFLDNHVEILADIMDFLGMNVDKDRIGRIGEIIHKDAKFRFLNDDSLIAAYDSIRNQELVKRLSYDRILPGGKAS